MTFLSDSYWNSVVERLSLLVFGRAVYSISRCFFTHNNMNIKHINKNIVITPKQPEFFF